MDDDVMWKDYSPGPHGTPSPDLARRLASDPVGTVVLPSGDTVPMAVRYDDVRAILSCPHSSRTGLSEPGRPRLLRGLSVDDVPGVLLNMDDPEHARQRRILAGAFTLAQAERWRGRCRAIAHELIDSFSERPDLVADYAAPLSARLICTVIGMPGTDYDRFKQWSEAFLRASPSGAEARMSAFAELARYMGDLVARRRAEPGDALVDVLMQATSRGDRLSDEELVNVLLMLAVAGHETPAMMIARGLYTLLRHPGQYRALVADPALTEPAVEEILRFDGPGTNGLLRRLTADVELPSGAVLPAGTVVLPNSHAANHDPAAFPDPGRFDIRRHAPGGTARPHLAFSHGPHFCLGNHLARVQLQEAVRALAERVPGLRPAEDPGGLPWTEGNLAYRPARLPVLTA
ncbi:cytochrome P450 [Nonomuraea sp. NPDC049684]|uniref:cytochrome P450 n=1 Tax=Nonomuraea sp. NPDC049684 TaxID=3364356 RepID=UPI0037B6F4A2